MSAVPAHDVFLVDAVRTPIGAVHGKLAGTHPVRLLASVAETILTRCRGAGEMRGSVGVFCGCADQIGAQAGNVAAAAMSSIDLPIESLPVMVTAGELSGQMALDAAIDAVASGRFTSALALGIGHASTVAPGATLLSRDYGRPWDGLESPMNAGAACDELARSAGISTYDQVEWARAMHHRASMKHPVGTLLDSASSSALPLTIDELSGTAGPTGTGIGLFAEDGTVTAEGWAPLGDGAVAIAVSSRKPRQGMRFTSRGASSRGDLADSVRMIAIEIDTSAGCAAIDSRAAVIDLTVMAILGLNADTTNPTGSGLAIGRPPGIGGLVALNDIYRHARLTSARALLLSTSTSGNAAATLLEPV